MLLPSAIRSSTAQDSMLMNPGATAMPDASMILSALASSRSPTAAMRSPSIATSATTPAAPVPS
jgi:hypothetical protein